jgi:AraC family transcriptional regulator
VHNGLSNRGGSPLTCGIDLDKIAPQTAAGGAALMGMRLPPGYLYGDTLRSSKLASFELSERVYSPHFETPRHSHKRALICFVIQGEYTEIYGSRTRECKASSLLFHPAGELHAESFHDSGGRSFIVEVEPLWLERVREDSGIQEELIDLSGRELEALASRLYREFGEMDAASPLVIEGLMLEIIGEAWRRFPRGACKRTPRWLSQARELLSERFAERLKLSDVAKTVGIHPVHLAQTFHKTYNCTMGDYVRQRRIEYARRKLAGSEMPIVDVALTAGFCDQSHFTRTFKRCTGVPPSRYRESFRNTSRN